MIAPQFSLTNLNGWRAGWQVPDRAPVPDWAKRNLKIHYSPTGAFDITAFRYQEAVFEALQNELVREVHICGAVQTGKSQIIDIFVAWIMANDPGSIMWTFQSDEDGREHLLTRCWPMWNKCKALAPLWPTEKNRKNTMDVYFPSFFFLANGANPNSLQSKTVRWKFNSELWLPVWQDLYKQAEARVSAYVRTEQSKIVNDSQSGNEGDVMDKACQSGSQSTWSAPCPVCKEVFPLKISQKKADGTRFGMIWNEDAKKEDGSLDVNRCVETVRWRCACGHEMPDNAMTRNYWNDSGRYVDANPKAPATIKSFWWGSVHVHPMKELAKQKAQALNVAAMGDMSDIKTFRQQRENIPWKEVNLTIELSTKVSGYKYADYTNGELWEGEIHRGMMMDRQHGIGGDSPHRWVEIRAYQASGGSRQLYFGRVNTKEAAREIQARYGVKDRCVWQDFAFEKHLVLQECIEYGWTACAGSPNQQSWTHYTQRRGDAEPVKITLPYSPIQLSEVGGNKVRAAYVLFNGDYCADILANLIAGNGAGWENPDDVSEECTKGYKGEQKIEKRPGVWKWEKISQKNHSFDLGKMQVCFALMLKLLALPKMSDAKPEKAA